MRAYKLLLHLYPASFRNEYGEEMRALFARRRREAGGPFGVLALWLSTMLEVAGNAASAHADILRQDLSYTARVLRRSPGFAVTAVVIVALGIGATTAAFSVTDFVLIRPLPFPESERLVKVWQTTPSYPRLEFSPANYRDWKQAATSFESMATYFSTAVNVIGEREPVRLTGASVSADLFPTLGVSPLIGRTFTAADDRAGAAGALILSYQLWQSEFGGDSSVLSRTLTLDNAAFAVIGVMPPAFHFPTSTALFWTTNRFTEASYRERGDFRIEVIGRLRRGVTLERARAEMMVVAEQSRQQYPVENRNVSATVIALRDEVSERSRLLLVALSGAAGCVLLIACANLANLLLARALGRRRELAVRTAMGAGRERLVRQLLTESLLLAGAGGALGVGLATLSVPLLTKLVPLNLPVAAAPSVDIRVLFVAIGLTVVTGIVFGLAPVLRAGGSPNLAGLREGSRAGGGRKERLRSALVVVEIVASVVLLVSAGLLIRALLTVQRTDPGFDPDGVLTMRTPLPMPQYGTVATRDAFYTRVLGDIRALPGVTQAAYVSFLPMTFRAGMWPLSIPGRPSTGTGDRDVAPLRYVTPGYFATLSIPMTRGRDISESDDRDHAFVAVISESFARRYWPNQDPIGRHLTFAFADRVVVGVVGDIMFRGLERVSEPQVYLSSKQVNDGAITFYSPKELAVKSSVPPATLAPSVRAIIRKLDPRLPIYDVRTLSDVLDLETASRSVQVRVLSAFALVAFVLAAVGIHGLLSFAVSQREQEIGVRVALGAQAGDIVSMVLGRSLLLAVLGVVPGVAVAYAAGRSMEALLAGVQPADALTLASAVVLSVVMTVAGSVPPTIRALRIDPITALRAE